MKKLIFSEVRSLVDRKRCEHPGRVFWLSLDPSCHLYLRVSPSGREKLYFRKKTCSVVRSLGNFSFRSFQEAHAHAMELEAKTLRGEVLPMQEKGADRFSPVKEKATACAKTLTLADTLKKWFDHEAASGRWDLTSGRAQTKFFGIVKNHVQPRLPMPLACLTPSLVEVALTDIYRKHRSTGLSLRSWVCGALRWAEDAGILPDGRWQAAQVRIDLQEKWRSIKHGKKKHHGALAVEQAPAFFADLNGVSGTAARALEVTILTCMRTASVINMRWADLDLQQGLWICPVEDVKEKKNGAQIVYLSRQVVQILRSMPRVLRGGKPATWVFSTARGERICSDLCKVIESLNRRRQARKEEPWLDFGQTDLKTGQHPRITAHGFRATFT